MQKRAILSAVLFLVFSSLCSADVGMHRKRSIKVRVAVIDTGIDATLMSSDSLCDNGHKDFTDTGLNDRHGHGTHISGIIDQYAKNFFIIKNGSGKDLEKHKLPEYCQIIIKYYDPKSKKDPLRATINSFRWAIDHHANIINYSGGGKFFSKEEREIVLEALNKGIKVVAAAGNEAQNIDQNKYYPAMYDKRIFIVGNLVVNKVRKPSAIRDNDIAESSNYGTSVNTWELGTNVLSRMPNGTFGLMTGTSQATAVKSGKIVRQILLTQ